MSTGRLIQRQLDDIESMIDEAIDQMADVCVWVRHYTHHPVAELGELMDLIKRTDEKRLQVNRILEYLDLSRKRLIHSGNASVKLSKVIGANSPTIKITTLRVEHLMHRMQRTAAALEQLNSTDVTGLWLMLRTQLQAYERGTTHPALGLHHEPHPH